MYIVSVGQYLEAKSAVADCSAFTLILTLKVLYQCVYIVSAGQGFVALCAVAGYSAFTLIMTVTTLCQSIVSVGQYL